MGSLDPCHAARPPSLVGVSFWSLKKNTHNPRRPPPDTLESPRSESQGTPCALRRLTSPCDVGLLTMRIHSLATGERRGTSSVRFSLHFLQVTPPSTRHVVRGYSPTPRTGVENQPLRFRCVRTLAHMHGRIVVPPAVSRPGHFDAAPDGTTLAAYPSRRRVRAMTSVRGRTRTGRMWFQRTAPFETWYENPSTHANAGGERRGTSASLFPVRSTAWFGGA